MPDPSDDFPGSDGPAASDGPLGDDRLTDSDGSPATDGDGGDPADSTVTVEEGPGGREVVVPLAVYKRVTVVSTLLAMVFIVAGFVLLDRATNRATLPVEEVDPLLALAGLGSIALGGLTYAYSTRFRAAGMGSSKTDENGPTDDG